jgi:Predicted permeases
MKLIDRFVSRELLVNVAFAIAVLSLVLVVGNIFRKLLPLLVNHDVPMEYLITFIAYVLPFSLIFTIPWGLLTAILLVFGRLSADNELIALRANGVSVTRVSVPLAGIAIGCTRFVSGSMCRLRLPRRRDCAVPFLISPRGIPWRFLAAIRSSISFPAGDLCRQKGREQTREHYRVRDEREGAAR